IGAEGYRLVHRSAKAPGRSGRAAGECQRENRGQSHGTAATVPISPLERTHAGSGKELCRGPEGLDGCNGQAPQWSQGARASRASRQETGEESEAGSRRRLTDRKLPRKPVKSLPRRTLVEEQS